MKMWGASSQKCENNCQCSGLITENFRINSGNSGTKRKQEEAFSKSNKLNMIPHSLDFNRKQSPITSPIATPSKRRVLGEITNSPIFRPKNSPTVERLKNTPKIIQQDKKSPSIERNSASPITSRGTRRTAKITKIFEDRTKFKMSNKENEFISETFLKLDVEEETRDCSFGGNFPSCSTVKWPPTQLDFTDALLSSSYEKTKTLDILVPEKENLDLEESPEKEETLHDLEEFESQNFDECTKYEIVSTDSPDIISSGRQNSRKIKSKNFSFGAPLSDNEASTSFNRQTTIRTLKFEDDTFEFASPAVKKSASVKKSLKFTETPPKDPVIYERNDSSVGFVSLSPSSTKLRIFPSESTTSMESGFVSEFEEPFLDIEDITNSPKVDSFKELLSGQIKNYFDNFSQRRPLQRSISYNPRAKVALFPITESPKKTTKRAETSFEKVENISNKRRKSNKASPVKTQKPVLQRAMSENNASIMSALAKSVDQELIGDFSLPFALPLTSGDHGDLKSISCDTLAGLLRGVYSASVNDFKVIDCRYPYEYEGGHILGAINMYSPPQILSLVNEPVKPKEDKRSILVFHCEFSLERGPKLSRFLRSSDRAKHEENYPSLNYPEIYLLHQGYRNFYKSYPDLCTPPGYTAMLDPKHRESYKRHLSNTSSNKYRNKIL